MINWLIGWLIDNGTLWRKWSNWKRLNLLSYLAQFLWRWGFPILAMQCRRPHPLLFHFLSRSSARLAAPLLVRTDLPLPSHSRSAIQPFRVGVERNRSGTYLSLSGGPPARRGKGKNREIPCRFYAHKNRVVSPRLIVWQMRHTTFSSSSASMDYFLDAQAARNCHSSCDARVTSCNINKVSSCK